MSMTEGLPAFPNYIQLRARSRLSLGFWAWARAIVVIAPQNGLLWFWRLSVPLWPLVFLVAPGLWRNLCPLATANQTPRLLRFTLGRTPPAWFQEYGYAIGFVAFFILASSRKWLFNTSGPATALLILAALVGALAGGLVFKGKSGWCSSICPVYPVQRLYNQTPFATIANSHCQPCVGCTKNCYDFNPGVAYLADLYDDDRHYSNYRKFFAAAMPGFVVAFFTQPDPASLSALPGLYVQFAFYMVVSAGLFFVMDALLKVTANKLTALCGAAAFSLFYAFGLPSWLGAVGSLLGQTLPAWLTWLGDAVIVGLSVAWVVRTYRKEPLFLSLVMEPEETRITPGAARVLKQAVDQSKSEVTFMPSQVRVIGEAGRTHLEIAESNHKPIEAGCRMGVCGSDPVLILNGMENLARAGTDEKSTLARLGLGPDCRMACMSRVSGQVTISLDTRGARAAAPSVAKDFDRSIRSVVIIGNGIAGVTAADTVRRYHPECEIHLVGREPHHLYNRMAISRLVYGRSAMNGLYLQPDNWYNERKITCWLNTRATRIDRDRRQVQLATGENLPYDRLILAMGSSSVKPPIAARELPGIFVLRDAEDAMRIRANVQIYQCRRAVVAGGGLLGLEAAYALHRLGLEVSVLERGEWLLRRQSDVRGSFYLRRYLEGLGIEIVLQAEAAAALGDDRLTQVTLKDGRTLLCDLLLVAVGIQPNVELARAAGLTNRRGIVVDASLRTSAPEIYAAGDVCEFEQEVPGLWPVAVEQARVAATNALGGQATYHTAVPVTVLKGVGVDLTSVGRIQVQLATDIEIAIEDTLEHRYRKLVIADGKLVGAVMMGYPLEASMVTAAVKASCDVSDHLDALRAGRWEVLGELAL